MTKDQHVEAAEKLLAEIAGDDDIGDIDYIEVMQDIAYLAKTMAEAKREEMEA